MRSAVGPSELEAVRARLRCAAAGAQLVREAAWLWSDRLQATRWRRRAELERTLRRLYRSGYDALRHASTLEGYALGFEARTRAYERLSTDLPELDSVRKARELGGQLAQIMHRLEEALRTHQRRDSWRPTEPAPILPGPKRTAELAARHLAELALASARAAAEADSELVERTRQNLRAAIQLQGADGERFSAQPE